jgi:hypothetical protein
MPATPTCWQNLHVPYVFPVPFSTKTTKIKHLCPTTELFPSWEMQNPYPLETSSPPHNRNSRIRESIHSGSYMTEEFHFAIDKCKAPVRLRPRLYCIAEILKQGNKIVLGRIWRKISDVDGGLLLESLVHTHVVTLHTMGWKMMMAMRRCRSHSHSSYCSLLWDRRLALLVGPIAANSAGTKDF